MPFYAIFMAFKSYFYAISVPFLYHFNAILMPFLCLRHLQQKTLTKKAEMCPLCLAEPAHLKGSQSEHLTGFVG